MGAADAGSVQVVQLLLGAGADVQKADACGTTALARAAGAGSAQAVRCLLKHGADPLLRDEKGRLALHYVSIVFAY